MAYSITFPDQYLALDSVPLSTPAWELTNIEVMLSGPATRGANLVLPGVPGSRARPKRAAEKTVSLELYVFGDKDSAGTPNADPVAGLLDNIAELRAITDPTDYADSVVSVALHWKGATLTGSAQVAGFEVGSHVGPSCVAATLDLVLLEGALTEVS